MPSSEKKSSTYLRGVSHNGGMFIPRLLSHVVCVLMSVLTGAALFSVPLSAHAVTSATQLPTMSAGESHACAVTDNGEVWCWGTNNFGQLGSGDTESHAAPVRVRGLTTRARAVDTGVSHSCALMIDDTVQCWGWNYHAQLGVPTLVHSPVAVISSEPGDKITAFASGSSHVCAVVNFTKVQCWGSNFIGELGDPYFYDRYSVRPRTVTLPGNRANIVQLALGSSFSCALTSDSQAWCWGHNLAGQLGDGTDLTSDLERTRRTPVTVAESLQVPAAFSAGHDHMCSVSGQQVQCWGNNISSAVGVGNGENIPTSYSSPQTLDITGDAIAAGPTHTCVSQGPTISCFGRPLTSEVLTEEEAAQQQQQAHQPRQVTTLNAPITDISSGRNFLCALTTLSQVWCYGQFSSGQLGKAYTQQPGNAVNALSSVLQPGATPSGDFTPLAAPTPTSTPSAPAPTTPPVSPPAPGTVAAPVNTGGSVGSSS